MLQAILPWLLRKARIFMPAASWTLHNDIVSNQNVDTFVVYRLEQATSEPKGVSLNPIRGNQPLLVVTAVHLQPV